MFSGGLLDRRDLLRVGSVSLAASLLPRAGEAKATAAHQPPGGAATSVILLWMGGGVTHIDSFDPKPEAPEAIRGTLSDIATTLPGVRFGEPMPHLARIADQLAVLRSFSHDSNDHLLSQAYTLCGRKVTRSGLFSEPNLGSIVSYLYGARNGLPGYIAVPGITRPGPPPNNLFVGGWLGNRYAPFCVGGQPEQPDFTVGEKEANPSPRADENLNPPELTFPRELTLGRLNRRASLRRALDRALGSTERRQRLSAMDGQYRDALQLLSSPTIRGAFDISREPVTLRDTYGRTKIGGRCLLARRLVEAGARFVMVDYGYDPDYGNLWDNHAVPSQKQPHISKMCLRGYHLAGMDKAFAALISDLKDRGLLQSTLVVFLTEFGRTPKINRNGGRDHWGACGSLFFSGGGTHGGQVIGKTDNRAAYPVTRPFGPDDVAATIYNAIGLRTDRRVHDRQNRPHPLLDRGRAIPGIL